MTLMFIVYSGDDEIQEMIDEADRFLSIEVKRNLFRKKTSER